MRVFGRALILGGLLCAFAPPADAGPILWSPDGHPECDADSNCTLFSLGALTGTALFGWSYSSLQRPLKLPPIAAGTGEG